MVAGDGSGAALASGVFSLQQAGTSVGGLAALNEELGELGTRGTVFTVAFARGVRLAGEALGKRGTVGGTVVEQAAPRGDRTHQRQLFQRTNSPNHNSRNPLLAVPTKPTPQSPPPPPSALCRPPHPLPTTAPPLLSFLKCLPIFNPLQLHSLLPSSGVWVCAGVFVGVQPGWGGVEY